MDKREELIIRQYYARNGLDFNDYLRRNQTGGAKRKEVKYMNKTYILNIEKCDDRIEIKVMPQPADCGIIFIHDGMANLQSLVFENKKCAKEGLPRKDAGKTQLNFILYYLRKHKRKYNIKKIIITDKTSIICKTESIKLADMYMVTRGDTWYGKFGFVPLNNEYLHSYNECKELMAKLKSKAVGEATMKQIIINAIQSKFGDSKYLEDRLHYAGLFTKGKFIDTMKKIVDKDCLFYYYIQNELRKYLRIIPYYSLDFVLIL